MSKKYWKILPKTKFTIEELIRKYKNKQAPALVDGATPYPVLTPLPDDKWKLLEDWHCAYDDGLYTVPAGFITDGASIPRFLWFIYGSPMDYPYSLSALLHDYLYVLFATYDKNPNSKLRKLADEAFRDYSIQLGVSKFMAYTEYHAIRFFGGAHWGEDELNKDLV